MPTSPTNPEDDDAYYRAVLHDLIDRAQALARTIQERAAAATPTLENRPDSDPSIAFDRVARAIRRTIALARHIATTPAPHQTPHQTSNPRRHQAARTKIIRDVEDAIHAYPVRTGKRIDTDALYAELHERLDDPALEDDIDHRPVEDIIADICQDLNVAAQGRAYIFRRRTPPDVKHLRTRAQTRPSTPSDPTPSPHTECAAIGTPPPPISPRTARHDNPGAPATPPPTHDDG